MLKAQNCTKTSVNGCVRQVLATEGSLFYSPFPPPHLSLTRSCIQCVGITKKQFN